MLKQQGHFQNILFPNISQFRLHFRQLEQQFLATGNWQLATGNWQLATGNWQLPVNIMFNRNLTGQSAPELC
jgi:hypothetical protein